MIDSKFQSEVLCFHTISVSKFDKNLENFYMKTKMAEQNTCHLD